MLLTFVFLNIKRPPCRLFGDTVSAVPQNNYKEIYGKNKYMLPQDVVVAPKVENIIFGWLPRGIIFNRFNNRSPCKN